MATILIEKNVMVPMRDGVKLATDINRMEGTPPTPVLVVRTPYNKDFTVAHGDIFNITDLPSALAISTRAAVRIYKPASY